MNKNDNKVMDCISKYIDFDKTDSKIGKYILNKYNYIPYLNLTEFMKEINISEVEVKKFLYNNGYNSFSEFQSKISKSISELIHDSDTSCSINSAILNKQEIIDLIHSNVEIEVSNMNNMISNLDYEKFINLIDDIRNSPEVIIIGTRASISLAQYASYLLNKIGINVKKITSADTSSFDNIQNFDRSSLVIAFGFPRYPKETIKLLNYFNRKNFKIISVTDSENSPLCNFSTYSILVQSYSLAYTDSFINGLTLINTIALAIGKIDNKKVVKRLNDFEDTANSLEYYF
jgi:DNA-binding MurR/RpiR family transcriptional regulator